MKPAPLRQIQRMCFVTETDLGSPKVSGAIINDLKILRQLERFGDIDVIYLQKSKYKTLYVYLPIYLLAILRSLFKPYRIYLTRSIIASFILTSLRALGRKEMRIIHQAFSVPFTSFEVKYLNVNVIESFSRSILYRFFEKWALPRVDIITIASDDHAKALIKIGIEPSRIHIVPMFVENDFFNQPLKKARGVFTLCYVGGFHLYHSLQPLIEAFELMCKTEKNVNLLFVGTGPQKARLEREVERRKLTERIKFVGKVPHSSLPAFLSNVDCVVSLIPKFGMSISLLEAAASGKAILAFTLDNAINHYFRHGENIYLLSTLSPNEIANAIRMIYNDSKLRETIARGAREVALNQFSEEVTSRRLQTLMIKVCKND